MPTPLICYPNRADAATLSGGSWTAARPASSVQTREVSDVARSTDATSANTKIRFDLGAAYPIRVVGIFGHNLSLSATVRIYADDENTYTSPPYDQTVDAFPAIYPSGTSLWGEELSEAALSAEDWAGGRLKYGVIHVPGSVQDYRYWGIDIVDTGNADGYVEIGRVFIGQAWDPGRHFVGGAQIGARGQSERFEMPYGGAHYRERQQARYIRGTFEGVLTDEALIQGLEGLHMVVGTTRQVVYVHDTTDTYHMPRRSFLGTVSELSAMEMPYATAHDIPVEIAEEIA